MAPAQFGLFSVHLLYQGISMTISVDQIAALLEQSDFNFEREDEIILSGLDLGDGQAVSMIFVASGGGSVFKLAMGRIIPLELIQASDHKAVFHLYLLSAAWNSSFGTPEVDRDDGELRVLVEIPLADAVMTLDQLRLAIHGAGQLCDLIRKEGTEVLRTGQLPKTASPADAMTAARHVIVQLIETPQGRVQARALATDPQAPQFVRDVAKKMIPVMDAMDKAEEEAAPTSI
jgi:hypothetical protein